MSRVVPYPSAEDLKKLGLLRSHDYREHLQIEIRFVVVGFDERLKFLDAIFVVEKLSTFC